MPHTCFPLGLLSFTVLFRRFLHLGRGGPREKVFCNAAIWFSLFRVSETVTETLVIDTVQW
jgi:hypothetical protein